MNMNAVLKNETNPHSNIPNISNIQHFKIHQDEDQILWVGLDRQGSTVNTLNHEVLEELKQILTAVSQSPLHSQLKGIIFYSAKPSGFIAGADILQFKSLNNEEMAFKLIREGQNIFQQLVDLPIPTVAMISGFCLGGGLELALACRYRIAEDDPKTKLGLPEVMLGIHPGWGGSVRLPRIMGAVKALDLILTGRKVSAKAAKKMGFVDEAVPKRHLETAARDKILRQPPKRVATLFEAFTNSDVMRPLIGKYFYKKLNEKINRTHYPAPYSALDLWIENGIKEDAFLAEAKSIEQLLMTDTAKNLIRVFGLQEKLKANARNIEYKIKRIHIVGAGVMGGDIAAVCAMKGIRVSLQDSDHAAIAKSLKRAKALFEKVLKEPHLIQAAEDRITPDVAGEGARHADIILEAIVEKKEAKQNLFKTLEKLAKPDAIFATNTSTIPLEDIGSVLQDPARLVGIHFFNPVAKMPLVEVVKSNATNADAYKKALALVKALDKYPLPVKSSPGFLVNRVLMPYLMESMQLLEEGIPKEVIDKSAKEFGMPMGPIELADTVGLDVCLYAAESLKQYLPTEANIPAKLRELVEKGHLGKKTNSGFYQYRNGHPILTPLDPNYHPPNDIIDRLMLRMINEAVCCLREHIVEDADFLDAGMIFGAGFPPFRGGPLHYAKEQGEDLLLQHLHLLVQRYGNRFLADKGWELFNVA